jgi:hypothetical protein
LLRLSVIHVEAVQEPMKNRRCKNCYCNEQHHAAVECVDSCEDFPCFRLQLRDGSHATHKHGSIQKSICPRQTFKHMITHDSNYQRRSDEPKREQRVFEQPANEHPTWQEFLVIMLESVKDQVKALEANVELHRIYLFPQGMLTKREEN